MTKRVCTCYRLRPDGSHGVGCDFHVPDHRMIPGSHERPAGAECVCGASWDRGNDRCVTEVDR